MSSDYDYAFGDYDTSSLGDLDLFDTSSLTTSSLGDLALGDLGFLDTSSLGDFDTSSLREPTDSAESLDQSFQDLFTETSSFELTDTTSFSLDMFKDTTSFEFDLNAPDLTALEQEALRAEYGDDAEVSLPTSFGLGGEICVASRRGESLRCIFL